MDRRPRAVAHFQSLKFAPARWSAGQPPHHVRVMSALPSKADIVERDRHVRFVPKADIWINCYTLPLTAFVLTGPGKYVSQTFDDHIDFVVCRHASKTEADGAHADLGRDAHGFENR